MLVPDIVRSLGGKIATKLGYNRLITWLINIAPIHDNIKIHNSAKVERGVKLAGNIDIGEDVEVRSGSRVQGNIKINKECTIRDNSIIRGRVQINQGTNINRSVEVMGGKVTMGKYCAIARNVTFQSRNHTTAWPSMQLNFYKTKVGNPLPTETEPIIVGDDVWVGTKVIILPGVTIGNGAIVAAGSIVVDDVEPYSLVAGVPAIHKKYRFDQHTREQLDTVSWWDWSDEKIINNKEFFHTDLNEINNITEVIND
jgi:virginiamycin A acetyltransferase